MRPLFVCASLFFISTITAQDTVKNFHRNGYIREYYTMLNGRKHGHYVTWYKNSQIKNRLSFDSGLLSGLAYLYNKNGQIVETCYYIKGKIVMQVIDKKRNWITIYWTDSGVKIHDIRFKNGQPLSCTQAIPLGKMFDTTNVLPIPDKYTCNIGNRIVFVTNNIPYDSLGHKIKNKFNGSQLSWYENGKPRLEKHYKYGKLHGIIREWNSSGNLKTYEIYRRGILQRKII